MKQKTKKVQISTPQAFIDYVNNSSFNTSSVQPWERETLEPYIASGSETKQAHQVDTKHQQRAAEMLNT